QKNPAVRLFPFRFRTPPMHWKFLRPDGSQPGPRYHRPVLSLLPARQPVCATPGLHHPPAAPRPPRPNRISRTALTFLLRIGSSPLPGVRLFSYPGHLSLQPPKTLRPRRPELQDCMMPSEARNPSSPTAASL